MAASGGQRTRTQRVVNAAILAVAVLVTLVAVFFVVAAGLFHLKYDEPDPKLAERFADAVRGADGRIDLADVRSDAWDTVSLMGPFTDLDAVRACIGVSDWDQDGALADYLNRDNQSALVFVHAGEVTAATWSIWQQIPFETPRNLCGVPRTDAVFDIATRTVEDPKAGRVEVYRLEPGR